MFMQNLDTFIFFYATRTMIPQFSGLLRCCCRSAIAGVRTSNKCLRYAYEYHTPVDRNVERTQGQGNNNATRVTRAYTNAIHIGMLK